MLKGLDIGAVDLDDCHDPEKGETAPWAQEYVDRFPDAYVETTVSGRGLRILGTSTINAFAPKFKSQNGNGAGVELFSNSHHYLTLSCNALKHCDSLPPIENRLKAIAEELGGRGDPASGEVGKKRDAGEWSEDAEARLRAALKSIPTDEKELVEKLGGHAHDIWIKIGRAIERLAWGERGYALFRDWSAGNAQEFNEDGLRTQWESFARNRDGKAKPLTIATVYRYARKCGWTEDEARALLPRLDIDWSDLPATAKKLAKMIAERDDYLFNGNRPVRIIVEADGMPCAIEVVSEALRVYAHEICDPWATTKHGLQRVTLSHSIAALYLHGLAGSWGLKVFRGITTAPILDNDGGVRVLQGYDAATGLWCHNVPMLTVPDTPSAQDAAAALERIRHTFRTFPFADGERIKDPVSGLEAIDTSKPAGLDESAFVVALLTAVCRSSLMLAPGFLCEAPSFSGAGTGKGLLVKAICIVASGAQPSAFTSGHDAEEFDKRLTAALVRARPAIFLDNFNAKELRSDILDSALTESQAEVRIMGQTKMVPLHVRTFVGITGNGVQPAEDMARRLIVAHLDARMENPEERKFEPGFLDDIVMARASLLTDALTIWRWGRQHKNEIPRGRPLGSFEVWCQWVRDPLLVLGMRDPVERVAEIKAADPKREAVREVLDAWWERHRDTPVKAADLAQEVTDRIPGSIAFDGGLNRQRVAGWLRQLVGTNVGRYRLTIATTEGPKSEPVKLYALTKTEEER